MKTTERINHMLRGLFYSLTVTLGIYLSFTELDQGNDENFIRFAAIVSVIFLIELYTSWTYRNQMMLKSIPHFDRKEYVSHLLHHILIPLGAYWSIVGFTYFNSQLHLRAAILIFSFAIFTVLFINIRAFYERQQELEEQTHYIYDIAKMIIFFCTVNVISHWGVLTHEYAAEIVLICLLTIVLFMLVLVRNSRVEFLSILLSVVLMTIVGFSIWVLSFILQLEPLQVSLISTLEFYLAAAIIHHLMVRDLTWRIALEYVVVLVMAVSILLAIG